MTKIPAAAKIPAADGKRLHAFTALPSSSLTILGPRRCPAVKASIGNSDAYIQIFTSNGFQPLTNTAYIASIEMLKPDIAIALADINYAVPTTPRSKSVWKMCERTEEWVTELHRALDLNDLRASNTSVFAPTLPALYSVQQDYLSRLSGDILSKLSGLAVYAVDVLPDLRDHPSLLPLPRLSLDTPQDPHQILRQVSLGIDAFILPFLNAVSDAGVALTFTFPPPPPGPGPGPDPLPLGTDLTDGANAISLAPLVDGCACHACAAHHRAFLHHLLNAREMLAWTLLQVHNHHVAAQFFAGVRASLASGADRFEEDRREFARVYEASLPVGTGTRPRARGYHFKSDHSQLKRNKGTWQLFEEGEVSGGKENSREVEGKLARDEVETPVVPAEDVDAVELVREGMGEIDVKRV